MVNCFQKHKNIHKRVCVSVFKSRTTKKPIIISVTDQHIDNVVVSYPDDDNIVDPYSYVLMKIKRV